MKNIKPVGLKGKEKLERMKSLMGKSPINESKLKNAKLEISKLGPDNKVYAIIRENHEYYIKTSDKVSNLVLEDFNYIGGLKNKKDHAHESYAKAIKQLNLKMISLNEQFEGDKVNVFENDNLVGIDEEHDLEDEVCEDCMEEGYGEFEEEEITAEGELKVKAIQDGPKELKGNSVGEFEDSSVEPDDAPNDKSVGTEKSNGETATPKKTIKETTRKPKFSILNAIGKMESIFEAASKKKL